MSYRRFLESLEVAETRIPSIVDAVRELNKEINRLDIANRRNFFKYNLNEHLIKFAEQETQPNPVKLEENMRLMKTLNRLDTDEPAFSLLYDKIVPIMAELMEVDMPGSIYFTSLMEEISKLYEDARPPQPLVQTEEMVMDNLTPQNLVVRSKIPDGYVAELEAELLALTDGLTTVEETESKIIDLVLRRRDSIQQPKSHHEFFNKENLEKIGKRADLVYIMCLTCGETLFFLGKDGDPTIPELFKCPECMAVNHLRSVQH